MDNPVKGFKSLPTGGKIAVGVGGVVVVFYLYKRHTAAKTAASTTAPPSTDPAGNVGTIDPQTGYVYGSSQDQNALAQGSSGFSPSGYSGYGYTDSSTGTTGAGSSTTFGDNAAWAQAVQTGLETVGYSPTDVAQALGLYLGNQAMTNAQAAIVRAAIAEYGYPPAGSFTIKLLPTHSQNTKVRVPNVLGLDVTQADHVLTSVGLKAHGPVAVHGVTHVVTGTRPKAGSEVSAGSYVTLEYRSEGKPTPNYTNSPVPPIIPPGGGSLH